MLEHDEKTTMDSLEVIEKGLKLAGLNKTAALCVLITARIAQMYKELAILRAAQGITRPVTKH